MKSEFWTWICDGGSGERKIKDDTYQKLGKPITNGLARDIIVSVSAVISGGMAKMKPSRPQMTCISFKNEYSRFDKFINYGQQLHLVFSFSAFWTSVVHLTSGSVYQTLEKIMTCLLSRQKQATESTVNDQKNADRRTSARRNTGCIAQRKQDRRVWLRE